MSISPVNVHDLEKIRPLGATEQGNPIRHNIDFFNNVGISAQYSLVSPSSLPFAVKSSVFTALSHILRKHTILSTVVADDYTSHPYFARLLSINLDDAVSFMLRSRPYDSSQLDSDVELDEILQEQHNTPFQTNCGTLPLWRLVIISNITNEHEFSASFIFHHLICDGIAGMIFHRDLLQALEMSLAPLETSIANSPRGDIQPTVEELMPQSIPLPRSILAGNKIWTGEKIQMPLKSKWRSLVISKDTTRKFLQVCQEHGTSATATLAVIISNRLFELVDDEFEEIKCYIPINLRPFLKGGVRSDEMGSWVHGCLMSFRRPSNGQFPWSDAQFAKFRISNPLSNLY